MKLNWGTSIVIAIAGFICFILFFFIKGHFVQQDELVSEEYYDIGMQHDERRVWKTNAKSLADDLKFLIDHDKGVEVVLPSFFIGKSIKGTVEFLKPNNSKLDVNLILDDNVEGIYLITKENFVRGNYRMKAQLVSGDKTYYWERDFSY